MKVNNGTTEKPEMILTTREVAELLKVSERQVDILSKEQGLPRKRMAGLYRYSRNDVLQWFNNLEGNINTDKATNNEGEICNG